jgi:hypothetical protein
MIEYLILAILVIAIFIVGILINIASTLDSLLKKNREVESHLFFIKHFSEWQALKEGE